MSFNHNHSIPVLTRDNYEAAFLLYVDNELTPEQQAVVEAFVLLHPDLKEELDLLCSTRLPDDALSFEGKEALFADSMKATTVDESLLLYMDNELPAWEKEAVEAQLKSDEAFALQHALLLKTKLEPEAISYPNKKELYRHTERRLAPVWLRVAAAVLLLTGGAAVWLNMANTKSAAPGVAVVAPKENTPIAQPVIKPDEKPLKAESNVTTVEAKAPVKENAVALTTPVAKKQLQKTIRKETFSKPHTDVPDIVALNHLPVVKETTAPLKTDVTQKIAQALNNSDVTPAATSPYVVVNTSGENMVPVHPVVKTTGDERGGGSVKGFLRKATRFIERHTGIKTVNDDNELLVGAVALKL